MKPLLHFSSFRVGHSSGLAVLDPSDTLLDRRTTPRPRRSMTPSAWWSTLRNWTGGFTRMMIKLQDLDCYFLQAFAVRSGGWHDCHKQPGSMVRGSVESRGAMGYMCKALLRKPTPFSFWPLIGALDAPRHEARHFAWGGAGRHEEYNHTSALRGVHATCTCCRIPTDQYEKS